MNAKISVPFICVKAIIYLLLCGLHDSTFRFATENKFFCITFSLDTKLENIYGNTIS